MHFSLFFVLQMQDKKIKTPKHFPQNDLGFILKICVSHLIQFVRETP